MDAPASPPSLRGRVEMLTDQVTAAWKRRFLYVDPAACIERVEGIQFEPGSDLSFAVVIPMYNEQDNVVRCISTVGNFLRTLPFDTRIIAVNDASTDRTAELLEQMGPLWPQLRVVTHEKNLGYGGANVSGTLAAHREGLRYVLFIDADLTQDIRYLRAFVAEMLRGVDVIKATRYAGGGGVIGVPFRRWIVSWVGNFLARKALSLGITDFSNGFRAIRTELLVGLTFQERGFVYLVEEMAKLSRVAPTCADVPYVLRVREQGVSKFVYSPQVYFRYLRWLVLAPKRTHGPAAKR